MACAISCRNNASLTFLSIVFMKYSTTVCALVHLITCTCTCPVDRKARFESHVFWGS